MLDVTIPKTVFSRSIIYNKDFMIFLFLCYLRLK